MADELNNQSVIDEHGQEAVNVSGLAAALQQFKTTISDGKVDKINGKGLSTEDFTTALQTKLTQLYTKAEIDTLLSAMKSGLFVPVDERPTASADTLFKIYLVPAASSKTSNVKDEWITIITSSSTTTDPETGEEVTTYTYDWEKIGSTAVDVSGKADKAVPSATGNIAALDASGNLTDSGKTLGKSVPADAVFTDTTYSNATPSTSGSGGTDGLMSAADKEKLNGITAGATPHQAPTSTEITTALGYTPYSAANPNGYTNNTGTVTGIKVGSDGSAIEPSSGGVVTIPAYETNADVTDAENVKAALGTGTDDGTFLAKDGTWKTPDTGSAAAYTPTLAATPTSSTVSYTDPDDNTKQVWFEIGQFARVADAESDTGYVMYQLHDVTVTGAGTAQESHTNAQWMEQTGGGGDVTGKIKVSIAAFVNDVSAASSLLGNVTVSLTNTTDSSTPVTETWNGSDITFSKLTPMKNYRVAIEDKTGWLRDKEYADVTNLGISEERAVSFSYSADEYSCSVSGTADGRIVVSGTEYANGATFRVAKNTSITATAKAVTNYVTPTPSISGKTITATYVAYGYVTVNTASNQGQDATIAAVTPTIKIGDAAAVSYTAPVQVAPGTQVIVTWPAVTGYATPAQQTFTKSGTSDETTTGTYQTEVLTVSITKDTGDGNLATVSIAVTDGNTSLGTLTQASPTLKIPYGVNYTLTPSALDGYATPAAVTKDWADTTAKSVTFQYEEVTMLTGYIILDQTSSDPTTKVIDEGGHTYSNYQRPAVIDAIRAASHCYVGTFANNKMTLKQLDDSDGTKYADGTSAATDIASTDKDVFMRLPFFFTRVSTVATDKIKIEFAFDPNQTVATTAQPDGSGWKQWGGNDLIGKYKGYSTGSKLYSVSGQASTANISQANFKTYARALGTGFTAVKIRHQNLMAILFYAYYGHTNCQQLIGTGASSRNRITGQKNSLGMTDTTSANGNTDNIVFWGLENWWGDLYEWVDNVVVNNGTWTITENDGSTRTLTAGTHVMTAAGSWVYPSKFYIGDHLDVVGAVGQTGGSDSTGYCDGQYIANSASRVVARSDYNASTIGGVAFVNANFDSSITYTYCGSRLAFIGTIEIV